MFDQTVQFALDNLARQIARVDAGETDAGAIRVAAEQVLRVAAPAAVEDREYFSVDLALDADAQCGATSPEHNRRCSRRVEHVSTDHRSLEISWAVD